MTLPAGEAVGYENLIFKWASVDSYVIAFIFIHPSTEGASDRFKDFKIVGLEMKLSEETAQNLGDSNRIWDNEGSKETGVYFKKGKVVALVSALSKESARKFAYHIAECIPAA